MTRITRTIVVALVALAFGAPVATAMPVDAHQPTSAPQDLRGEASADQSRAPEAPVGLPTWPLHPEPVTPAEQQPVADGDGGGVDWPVPTLAIGGVLLLAGIALAGTRYRAARAAG
jgi:hypothetical protein